MATSDLFNSVLRRRGRAEPIQSSGNVESEEIVEVFKAPGKFSSTKRKSGTHNGRGREFDGSLTGSVCSTN